MQSAALKKTVDSGVVAVRWRGGWLRLRRRAVGWRGYRKRAVLLWGLLSGVFRLSARGALCVCGTLSVLASPARYVVRRSSWHRHPAYWGGPGPCYGYGW